VIKSRTVDEATVPMSAADRPAGVPAEPPTDDDSGTLLIDFR
jgi:hypothetical protein